MADSFPEKKSDPAECSSKLVALRRYLEGFGRKLLDESRLGKLASDLGFFSKPLRVSFRTGDFIIKLYSPVSDLELTDSVIKNHDKYIDELRSAGIRVPDTLIFSRVVAKKNQLVIIQGAFGEEELFRRRIINASVKELFHLCNLIFSDVLRFWKNIKNHKNLGFHPTLRNYALHNGVLFYFDTFPPMLMNQNELNKLILKWSPFGGWVRNIYPPRLMNVVSDEYYNLDSMFSGIVGSCCRLRPDDSGKILDYSREFVKNSNELSSDQKEKISRSILKAPRLSGIWLFIRHLSGNKGRPNIHAVPSGHAVT